MWTVASLALFVNTLDASIVNVALPSIGRDLGTGVSELQWVVDAYTLVLAALLLSAGTMGDRVGHARSARVGMVVFAAASVMCGCAPTAPVLIAARAIQGAGAALLMASTLSLLAVAFPDPAGRARAIGWWAVFAGLGFSAGPPLGGLLVTFLGWRSVFLVNVLPCAICLVLLRMGVRETVRQRELPFDGSGQMAAIAGLGSLLFGVIEGPSFGWTSTPVVAAFAVSVVASVFFVWRENRTMHPMLELALFRRARVSVGTMVAFAYPFGFLGLLFLLNLYLQTAQNRSPLAVGVLFLPLSTAVLVVGPVSGRITARFGSRKPMVVGLFVQAVGALLLVTAAVDTPYVSLVPAFVLLGAGSSLAATPAIHEVLSATSDRAGVGSGLANATRQLGASCGVAILGTVAGAPGAAAFVGRMHVAVAVAAAVPAAAGFVAIVAAVWRPQRTDMEARAVRGSERAAARGPAHPDPSGGTEGRDRCARAR